MEMQECHVCSGGMTWYTHYSDYALGDQGIAVEQVGFECNECGQREVRYENSRAYNALSCRYQHHLQEHI